MKPSKCLVCEESPSTCYFHLMPVCFKCYNRLKGRELRRKKEVEEDNENNREYDEVSE